MNDTKLITVVTAKSGARECLYVDGKRAFAAQASPVFAGDIAAAAGAELIRFQHIAMEDDIEFPPGWPFLLSDIPTLRRAAT